MSSTMSQGQDKITRLEFWRTLSLHKLRWALSLGSVQLLPVLEIGFVTLIYVMLEQSQREAAQRVLRDKGLLVDFGLAVDPALLTVFATVVLVIGAQASLRYLAETNLARLRILIYIENAQRLLDRYLN